VTNGDLPDPVFLAILIELRRDPASQPPADKHFDEPGQEIRLRDHRSTAVSMIDDDVALLEAQPFRVSAVEPLGDDEQLGYTQIDDLAIRFPCSDELPLEVKFLERLDPDALSAVWAVDETVAIVGHDSMVGEQLDARGSACLPILLLDQL
jgi:hypothetical protein